MPNNMPSHTQAKDHSPTMTDVSDCFKLDRDDSGNYGSNEIISVDEVTLLDLNPDRQEHKYLSKPSSLPSQGTTSLLSSHNNHSNLSSSVSTYTLVTEGCVKSGIGIRKKAVARKIQGRYPEALIIKNPVKIRAFKSRANFNPQPITQALENFDFKRGPSPHPTEELTQNELAILETEISADEALDSVALISPCESVGLEDLQLKTQTPQSSKFTFILPGAEMRKYRKSEDATLDDVSNLVCDTETEVYEKISSHVGPKTLNTASILNEIDQLPAPSSKSHLQCRRSQSVKIQQDSQTSVNLRPGLAQKPNRFSMSSSCDDLSVINLDIQKLYRTQSWQLKVFQQTVAIAAKNYASKKSKFNRLIRKNSDKSLDPLDPLANLEEAPVDLKKSSSAFSAFTHGPSPMTGHGLAQNFSSKIPKKSKFLTRFTTGNGHSSGHGSKNLLIRKNNSFSKKSSSPVNHAGLYDIARIASNPSNPSKFSLNLAQSIQNRLNCKGKEAISHIQTMNHKRPSKSSKFRKTRHTVATTQQ